MGNSYFRVLSGVYLLALIACLASRSLLVVSFTDRVTGFYTQQNGIVTAFNVCFAAAVLILFIFNRLRRAENDYPLYSRNRLAGILAILTGLAAAAFVLLDNPYPFVEQNYSEVVVFLREAAGKVLGVLASLSFLLFGAGALAGKVPGFTVVPALFASIWQVFLLVTRFNSYTTLTTIPDNLLAVLFMVFATLFLIGHARTVFGFSRRDGRNYVIPAGFCTSLAGLALVVPNYVAMAAERTLEIPAIMLGRWESVYVFFLSVYAAVYVAGLIRSIKAV